MGWLFHGKVNEAVEFEIAGLNIEIAPEESLRKALEFSGGDLSRFGEDATAYCQRERHDSLKGLAALATLGLSDLGSRISKETQACLVDSDLDGSFDHAFLVGLKREEDFLAVPIDAAAYQEFSADDEYDAENGDYIQVRVNELSLIHI